MKVSQVRFFGMCLVVVLAAGAVTASAAPALEAPELGRCVAQTGGKFTSGVCTKEAKAPKVGSFEWEPGAVKAHFKGVGGVGTLETVHRVKVV
jgi:hypothetical protein